MIWQKNELQLYNLLLIIAKLLMQRKTNWIEHIEQKIYSFGVL